MRIKKLNWEVKKLNWEVMSGHFGNSYYAAITGFSTNYYYYFDRYTNKFKCSAPDRKQHYFQTEKEVIEWCQEDYKARIMNLIDDSED